MKDWLLLHRPVAVHICYYYVTILLYLDELYSLHIIWFTD